MQKLFSFFFHKNIIVYAVFNDQSFNDTLTNDIVRFEQLGPDLYINRHKYAFSWLFFVIQRNYINHTNNYKPWQSTHATDHRKAK